MKSILMSIQPYFAYLEMKGIKKVSSISISEHYIEIHSERTSLNDTNFWGRIGDNVFLTKEAAEARLEELQGEQQ